jgi:hypothetical protein
MKTLKALLGASLLLVIGQASAATLQLDFDYDFSNQLDPGSETPDGAGPYMTAIFDDGDSPGSVTLTLTIAGDVGSAEVTEIYLNVDDLIGVENLTFTDNDISAVSKSVITTGTDSIKADADGWFDIFIDLPPPTRDRFTAGETLVYNITGGGITANDFYFESTPDLIDPNGPFFGAAKFQSTGDCVMVNNECTYPNSAWIGVVPIPAAVWLLGSGLGLLGWMRRRKTAV